MSDSTYDIHGGSNQIVPNATEANQYHTHIGELNVLQEPTIHYGSRQSRIDSYFRHLREEIESRTTREIIDDLLEYKTKLDGTKGLEEKLTDGGFAQSDIQWALRKKEQYAKKATKYECYPSAQEINLLLFADIKTKFDRYIFPLIKNEESVTVVMQHTHEVIVEPMMKMLNDNGEHDDYLRYTADHIYGMIYYLTGLCHLNWKDYDKAL